MGIFGKILSGLEVVGGVALEFVPGGQLAGAMLITEGLASSGLIGGSVGKFLKSGAGQALMMGASLATLGFGMYGAAQNAAAAASAGATAPDAAAELAANQAANTAVTADLGAAAPTPGAASAAVGVDVNAGVTAQSAGLSGLAPDQIAQAPTIDATGQPVLTQQATANVSAAVNPGANAAVNPGGQGAAGPATTANPAAAVKPSDLTGVTPPGANDYMNVPPAGGGGSGGGVLNRLFPPNSIGPSPGSALLQAGGNLVGGVGQGIEQKQAMEQAAAAQQYATRSYGGATPPGQNITVPQGYLARAQALKGMLGQTAGIAPAPAGSNTPVPIWQTNSAPRGGVPGG